MSDRDVTSERTHLGALGADDGQTQHGRAMLIDAVTGRDEQVGPGGDADLDNLSAKDFQLSNYSDRDITKMEFYLELVMELRRISHPHEGQLVTGVLREWAHDDPEAGLEPLTKDDLLNDETFKENIRSRMLQGKDMALLETTGKTTRESLLSRNDEDQDDGGLLGKARS